MFLLVLLLMIAVTACGMQEPWDVKPSVTQKRVQPALHEKTALQVAIDTGDVQGTVAALGAGAVLNVHDTQGAFVLHRALIKAICVGNSPGWQEKMEHGMQLVDVLLESGADYMLQERDSKRTVLHVLALQLSNDAENNKNVVCILDRLLKGICKADLKKAEHSNVQATQDDFVARMLDLCKRRNSLDESVIDIAKYRKCVNFFDVERFKWVYESAQQELASNNVQKK